jgi:hypothetical protein
MDSQETFELIEICRESVPDALASADRYRLLNDPELAETICLEVRAIEPQNQRSLRTLILAISDQFARPGSRVGPHDALKYVRELESEYERCYYTGLVAEREARAALGRARIDAYAIFREAMWWYEKADALTPRRNYHARLRYNSCGRTIDREGLQPPIREPELPLE